MPNPPIYVCPNCGNSGSIEAIVPIYDDFRYDAIACKCGALWRVYYKFEDPKVEVMYMPTSAETEAGAETDTDAGE